MVNVQLNGQGELANALETAIRIYPDLAEVWLGRAGRDFKKKAIKNTEALVKRHVRKNGIIKGYKVGKVKGYGVNMEVEFRGTAKHFHLVENGHEQQDRKGNTIGFVPGRHMVEKTRNEFESIMPRLMDSMIDDILRKSGLI